MPIRQSEIDASPEDQIASSGSASATGGAPTPSPLDRVKETLLDQRPATPIPEGVELPAAGEPLPSPGKSKSLFASRLKLAKPGLKHKLEQISKIVKTIGRHSQERMQMLEGLYHNAGMLKEKVETYRRVRPRHDVHVHVLTSVYST